MSKLSHSHLVAGAAAMGHGCLFSWEGRGSRPLAWLSDLATGTGVVEAAWLPKSKDPATQLTRAMHKIAGGLYRAEQASKREGESFIARWTLETRSGSAATPVAGERSDRVFVLVATLTDAKDLVIESTVDDLKEKLAAAYKERVDAEIFDASDVTKWLRDVVLSRFNGLQVGGGTIYVPRLSRLSVEALLAAFKKSGWGSFSPVIDCATGPELAAGAAWGIENMVSDVVDGFVKARETAAKLRERAIAKNPESKVSGDIGKEAAEGWMSKLRLAMDKLIEYTEVVGVDAFRGCKIAIDDAMIAIDEILMSVDMESEWSKATDRGAEREQAAAA